MKEFTPEIEEIVRNYLKENLRIETERDSYYDYGTTTSTIRVNVFIEKELISSDYFSV